MVKKQRLVTFIPSHMRICARNDCGHRLRRPAPNFVVQLPLAKSHSGTGVNIGRGSVSESPLRGPRASALVLCLLFLFVIMMAYPRGWFT